MSLIGINNIKHFTLSLLGFSSNKAALTEVLSLINDLAKEGLSVLLMTSEMNDLLSLSDRILVMADGKISKEFYRGNVNQEEIFKASVS